MEATPLADEAGATIVVIVIGALAVEWAVPDAELLDAVPEEGDTVEETAKGSPLAVSLFDGMELWATFDGTGGAFLFEELVAVLATESSESTAIGPSAVSTTGDATGRV
jgi:hypothetical protein